MTAAERDPVAIIEDWNKHLLEQDRIDKYNKMVVSPFVFYRGTNHLFWQDFAQDPRLEEFGDDSTRTWLKGDMHAENFGAFCNQHAQLVYDLNDFDDAIVADYQYDVWRMAVSLVLVARQNGIASEAGKQYLHAYAQAYLSTLKGYLHNDKATGAQFTKDNTSKRLSKFLEKVEIKQGIDTMLDKWTRLTDDARHFQQNEKLAPVTAKERTAILAAMPDYGKSLGGSLRYDPGHFAVLDIARRLQAGTGSLGAPRYYILLEGSSDAAVDHIILDVKQQQKPIPYHFLSAARRQEYDDNFFNDADRHAHAYRALTNIRSEDGVIIYADNYLGWMRLGRDVYSVRKRSPYKKTFPTEKLNSPKRLLKMAQQWAIIMASAHSRAYYFDPKLLPGPLAAPVLEHTKDKQADFCALVSEIALSYADRVEQDWKRFRDASALQTDSAPNR